MKDKRLILPSIVMVLVLAMTWLIVRTNATPAYTCDVKVSSNGYTAYADVNDVTQTQCLNDVVNGMETSQGTYTLTLVDSIPPGLTRFCSTRRVSLYADSVTVAIMNAAGSSSAVCDSFGT